MRATGLLLLPALLWKKAACADSAGRLQLSAESSTGTPVWFVIGVGYCIAPYIRIRLLNSCLDI